MRLDKVRRQLLGDQFMFCDSFLRFTELEPDYSYFFSIGVFDLFDRHAEFRSGTGFRFDGLLEFVDLSICPG